MPSRKPLPNYTPIPVKVSCMGDSLTLNYTNGQFPYQYWPKLIQDSLNAAGANVRVKNFGISGDTTKTYTGTTTFGMLTRFPTMYQFGVPKMAIIWGGHNDLSHAGAFVPLPSNVHNEVTRASIESMVSTLIAQGTAMIVIVGRHLLNYASGGDVTAGVVNAHPTMDSPPTNLLAAQYKAYQNALAANPGKIAFVDMYAYLATHLAANPSQIGVDAYYHVTTSNVHFNAFGNTLVAAAVHAQIVATWGIPALI